MSNEVPISSCTGYNSLIPVSSPLVSSWSYPISTSKEKTAFKIQSPTPSLRETCFLVRNSRPCRTPMLNYTLVSKDIQILGSSFLKGKREGIYQAICSFPCHPFSLDKDELYDSSLFSFHKKDTSRGIPQHSPKQRPCSFP